MANTHALIGSYTLANSTTNSVTFNSIPQTYTDLKVIISARATTGNSNLKLKPNGFAGSYVNFNLTSYGPASGGSVGQNFSTALPAMAYLYGNDSDAGFNNYLGSAQVYFGRYFGTNYKTAQAFSLSIGSSASTILNAVFNGTMVDTTAITSLEVGWYSATAYFQSGSTVYLYGIKNS